jgi:hypothetical protein
MVYVHALETQGSRLHIDSCWRFQYFGTRGAHRRRCELAGTPKRLDATYRLVALMHTQFAGAVAPVQRSASSRFANARMLVARPF